MRKKIAITLIIAMTFVLSLPFIVTAKTYTPAQVKIKSVTMSTYACNTVVVKWSKLRKNVKGYLIYRSTKKNGKYKRVAKVDSLRSKCELYTPKVGKTYYYKVRAYNKKSGKTYLGKWSSIKKITVKENGPAIDLMDAYPPTIRCHETGVGTIEIINYSKSKTVYIDPEAVSVYNLDGDSMNMYISSYAYTDEPEPEYIDLAKGEIIPLPPGRYAYLTLTPDSDQTIIPFEEKEGGGNIETVTLLVGYDSNAANDYSYVWHKDSGGSLF